MSAAWVQYKDAFFLTNTGILTIDVKGNRESYLFIITRMICWQDDIFILD